MRRLTTFAIIAIITVVAAACGSTATNNGNVRSNNTSVTAGNTATNANSGRDDDHMPGMNGNHQQMGEQHRNEGRNMEDRQMRRGMQNSANQNTNANK